MIRTALSSAIGQAVRALLEEQGLPADTLPPIVIEQPTQPEHGDYAASAAMQLARTLRQSPVQIAERLKRKLEETKLLGDLVERMEVAPPGYLNMFLRWEAWADAEWTIPEAGGAKVVVEHTSINPNKSAHIGHLRNACIGDALVRLFRRTGCRVEVHNYIDDLGNQLADTVVGLLDLPYQSGSRRFGDYCWDLYARLNKAYKHDAKLLARRTEVLHALEEGSSNTAWIGLLAAERIVAEHLAEMAAFGIRYDLLVWESSIVREGFWTAAFALLQRTPLFVKETEGKLAGCWVLRPPGRARGPENDESAHSEDKVLVRSNGILTYTGKDIAYHLWKFGLLPRDFAYRQQAETLWSTQTSGMPAIVPADAPAGGSRTFVEKEVGPAQDGHGPAFGRADLVVNVIDYRQEYPQAMVKQALEALGYQQQAEALRHVSYGVVSLSPKAAAALGIDTTDGRSSYAMSGRQGIGIKIAELLDRMEEVIEQKRAGAAGAGLSSRAIAAAAIRYYLLRFSLQTEVVFDLEQATELTGNTGVYLLYTHARACSLLDKAGGNTVLPKTRPDRFPPLERAETAVLRQLAEWPDRLHAAARDLTPHTLCAYAYELGTLFNHFYAACPILKADGEHRAFRLWLTDRVRETLADALHVLGLPAPERM
ncbi:arginine--tRNA ligase [Paenibacillus sp. J31TS4]|uniref:arginine--tRNA ligase n=1 Tax=Paenibacillus sp. J31TS4 TaxID=2807195 RepID=UPI001B0007CC|nr:arginine--tRNA ligase [Paenibacillus sp. J31TS4]GIP39066.1 arginine--tRNA ligase [Paenibacillus sp. J31TS4]